MLKIGFIRSSSLGSISLLSIYSICVCALVDLISRSLEKRFQFSAKIIEALMVYSISITLRLLKDNVTCKNI